MAKDFSKMSSDIMKYIGGVDNVIDIAHCATRLRFRLKNSDIVNRTMLEQTEGVIKTLESGGQFQIVIGNKVSLVYEEILKNNKNLTLGQEDKDSEKNKNVFDAFIATVAAIFTPVLMVMCGSGVLKGILAIAVSAGMSTDSGTYIVLYAAADAFFVFMPFLLAFSSAKRFGANQFLAVTLAGSLVYPNIITAINNEVTLTFLGIPLVLLNYHSTVLPIIVAVFVLSKLEKMLKRIIPEAVYSFMMPCIALAVMTPLSLLVIGPVLTTAANGLATAYEMIADIPILAGIIVGAFWEVLVIFGVHWTFVPIMLNNVSLYGADTLSSLVAPAIFSQAGAALGVFLKTKKQDVKSLAGSAALSGVFGITEPAIYGVTLKYKKPFYAAMLSGAVGAVIAAFSKAAGIGAPIPGLLTLPCWVGNGFIMFLVACLVAFVGATVLTYLIGYKDENIVNDSSTNAEEIMINKKELNKSIQTEKTIYSPLRGKMIPLNEVADEVFSSGALGQGVAVIPETSEVYAPVDGEVVLVADTKHALAFNSNNGMEVMIHMGLDTVKLDGKYFDIKVKVGEKVKKGDLIARVDFEKIKEEGYPIVTPVLVLNSDSFTEIQAESPKFVTEKDKLLTCK
ncbi:MAG: PTS transporter subunit EIIC [Firmicutes bacterium]|nr:PTS transporter subunit EIIC [Bacillota bacterium]